ncbi:MAG: RNA methyltransferase [Rhodothermales bacterium]|nr:RNA methyltransferase [Rhodothermales bacterium]
MELSVDSGALYFRGRPVDATDVSVALSEFVSASRQAVIDKVLSERTLNIATVVEGSINTGNVSAVMRTAEAFGFLPFHIIKTGGEFKNSSRSSQGSNKWLDIHEWETAVPCLDALHQQNYRIVATVPAKDATPIESLDYAVKTAFVFGNEAEGISKGVLGIADEVCRFPMAGFVESFNISVAAALCLYQAFQSRGGLGSGDLTREQMNTWRAMYYYRSVRRADDLLARMMA